MDVTEWSLLSGRLQLRRLNANDAAPMSAYRGLADVAKYQSWDSFGLQEAEKLIEAQAGVPPGAPGTWLQLGIALPPSGQLIGDCGIHFLAQEPRHVELGITLAPDQRGRGLAIEALGRVLDYVFGTLGKLRAVATVDQKNKPAAKLFRALGFRQEGNLIESRWFKGGWGSEFHFGILNREWIPTSRNTAPSGKDHFPQFPNPTGKWAH